MKDLNISYIFQFCRLKRNWMWPSMIIVTTWIYLNTVAPFALCPLFYHASCPWFFWSNSSQLFGIRKKNDKPRKHHTNWWLNQPIWKICASSNWIISSPGIVMKITNIWSHHLTHTSGGSFGQHAGIQLLPEKFGDPCSTPLLLPVAGWFYTGKPL